MLRVRNVEEANLMQRLPLYVVLVFRLGGLKIDSRLQMTSNWYRDKKVRGREEEIYGRPV